MGGEKHDVGLQLQERDSLNYNTLVNNMVLIFFEVSSIYMMSSLHFTSCSVL